ncbi:MAG: type II toxin-antitoxin system RelE/ParE family toxin [Rhizomicrobium sp.]|jgi:toxin ParE1/3/4
MKIIWSNTAERNLDAIWEYIAQDNLDAADRMIERLRQAADALIDHPHMGRAGRTAGTRELVVAATPYILIYRTLREHVDVARVFHGAQNWPSEE